MSELLDNSEENRGRDHTRNSEKAEKTRHVSKSKDRMSSMEGRLTGVETSVHEMGEKLDEISNRLEGLEAEDAAIHDAVRVSTKTLEGDFKKELRIAREQFMEEIARLRVNMEEQLKTLHKQVEEMKEDYAICKKAALGGTVMTRNVPKIDAPKPKPFVGNRNAREIENFIWSVEQYMKVTGTVEEESKIENATLYLEEAAALWWRRKHEDIKRGMCTIETWED